LTISLTFTTPVKLPTPALPFKVFLSKYRCFQWFSYKSYPWKTTCEENIGTDNNIWEHLWPIRDV